MLSNGYLDLQRRQIKSIAVSVNNKNAAETDTPTMIPDWENELTSSFFCFPPEVGRVAWVQLKNGLKAHQKLVKPRQSLKKTT